MPILAGLALLYLAAFTILYTLGGILHSTLPPVLEDWKYSPIGQHTYTLMHPPQER